MDTPMADAADGYDADKPPLPPVDGKLAGENGEGDDDDDDDAGEAPDFASMMGGMGGGEDGGMGGMDMNALMQMMGKGGGKGGGGGMDLASMMGGMGGMGGKGGGKGQAPPEDTDEKTCEKWVWSQKGEEVHIRIALDPPATSKKDVNVKFKSTSLVVAVRGDSIIDGALGGTVTPDDCTWCFSPSKDELQVMLTKVDGKHEAWSDLLQ